MASIALVEPRAPSHHVFSFAALPRLGLPSLAAVLSRLGHQVRIYCQGLAPIPMRELFRADVVGVSTTTSTAPEAYRIADRCRARGIPVVLGGVHATFEADEALEHADCCVLGEAENTIGDVIARLLAGEPVDDIAEACLATGERTGSDLGVCRVPDLDLLPFPDLDGINGWRVGRLTPMMTSRGCPHDCVFCSVTPMFGQGYRFRSPELVLEELAYREARHVFFYDDNFAASKSRTKQLLEGICRMPRPPRWMAQVRADVTGDLELVKLMRDSGCSRVFIGYESISPLTLESYNKHQSIEQIIDSVRILHEHDIKVHGMFVLGADADEVSTVRGTASFALKQALDSVQFLVLTPLPGTRQFQLLHSANRILSRDWSLYDGHHVVYHPLRMTAATLQREAWRAQKRFYSLWECVKDFARFRAKGGISRALGRAALALRERENSRFYRLLRRDGA